MTPPKPPLVIFDIDGTLIEESSRLRAQAEAVAEHFGGAPERLQAVVYAFFAVHDHMVQSGSTLQNNIPEYLYQMGERLGCPLTHNEAEVLAEQWTKAYEASHNEPVLFPDVVPCLRALQEHGCRLIIASGNTVATRVALLERTGIRDYFSTIYAAQDVGFQKQDKEFWSYLLKAEGYTSDDTVMVVGNQPNDDILQPINLGLKAFLITRPTELKKFSQDYHVAPTAIYDDLHYLITQIGGVI